jgi:hypothetical protein
MGMEVCIEFEEPDFTAIFVPSRTRFRVGPSFLQSDDFVILYPFYTSESTNIHVAVALQHGDYDGC